MSASAPRTDPYVLIVDPSRVVLQICGQHCRDRGLAVVLASAVPEALEAVASRKPLAILSALELPSLPGSSLLAALRASRGHRAIPVAVLTSKEEPEASLAAHAPDAVLRKSRDMLEEIDAFLDGLGAGRPSAGAPGAPLGRELENARILLAEDSPTNARIVGRVLHVAGADVDCMSNGAEVLEATAERGYDLILMDLHMPVMDGRAATRRLRARGLRTPIVALTAEDLDVFRQGAAADEFDDALPKPVEKALLLETCRRWAARGASLSGGARVPTPRREAS